MKVIVPSYFFMRGQEKLEESTKCLCGISCSRQWGTKSSNLCWYV